MNILIVDDESTNRMLVLKVLAAMGHVVNSAENGEKCKEMWSSSNPYDLVFLDWHLPGATGIELARLFRADAKRSPAYITMMTYTQDPAQIQVAFDAGVDDYVPKPLSVAQIWSKARAAERFLYLKRSASYGQESIAQEQSSLEAKQWFRQAIHEVSTPLAIIKVNSELIQDGQLSDVQLTSTCESIINGCDLVREILVEQLRKVDNGRGPLKSVELNELVTFCVKQVEPLARVAGVELITCTSGGRCISNGNPVELKQALFNLITNAIEPAKDSERPEVVIEVKQSGAYCAINVRDSGRPLENISGLVSKAATNGSQKGGDHLGLGLRLCRMIAEEHGGFLRATQFNGQNQFSVHLPTSN